MNFFPKTDKIANTNSKTFSTTAKEQLFTLCFGRSSELQYGFYYCKLCIYIYIYVCVCVCVCVCECVCVCVCVTMLQSNTMVCYCKFMLPIIMIDEGTKQTDKHEGEEIKQSNSLRLQYTIPLNRFLTDLHI